MVSFLQLLLKQGLMSLPTPSYSVQKNINSLHFPTQSDPDSKIDAHQVNNTWRSYNATQFQDRNNGSAGGRGGMRYPLPWFPLSDDPSWYSCRTTRGCRLYRLSLLGCRFGRSGSSGFVGRFRLLRWSGYVPVPRVRSCRDWCRYRYICRPVGLPARLLDL